MARNFILSEFTIIPVAQIELNVWMNLRSSTLKIHKCFHFFSLQLLIQTTTANNRTFHLKQNAQVEKVFRKLYIFNCAFTTTMVRMVPPVFQTAVAFSKKSRISHDTHYSVQGRKIKCKASKKQPHNAERTLENHWDNHGEVSEDLFHFPVNGDKRKEIVLRYSLY